MEDHELCKQLYELTGWEHNRPSATSNRWYSQNGSIVMNRSEKGNAIVPVYSTDYLLAKLQTELYPKDEFQLDVLYGVWYCTTTWNRTNNYASKAKTPQTALLKLAIELAQAGVIGKEEE